MSHNLTLTANNTSANPFISYFNFGGHKYDNFIEEVRDVDEIREATTSQVVQEVELGLEWNKILHTFNSIISDLEQYETEFGMNSEEFYNAFQFGEIKEEREEFYAWRTKYSAFQHMNRRFGLTR